MPRAFLAAVDVKKWELRPARDLGMPLGERMASERREPGLLESVACMFGGVVTRSLLRVWHRLAVEGREHLPAAAPFVLIANHTSHLDALVLASLVPWRVRRDLFPLAAGDVFFESTSRAVLSAAFLNALPMRRRAVGRHALDDLRRRLAEDRCAFVLFPEGTRATDGELARFKPGIGMLVAGTEVPVVPCHIEGAHRAWPKGARVPRPLPLRVRVGPPLRFADQADDRAGWMQIADACEQAVRALGT
jgi:1-acyl-sn-glycerol-3-phosphate acyltransferase